MKAKLKKEQLVIRFYKQAVAGHIVDFIYVAMGGQRDKLVRPTQYTDKQRFRPEWSRYRKSLGLPLSAAQRQSLIDATSSR